MYYRFNMQILPIVTKINFACITAVIILCVQLEYSVSESPPQKLPNNSSLYKGNVEHNETTEYVIDPGVSDKPNRTDKTKDVPNLMSTFSHDLNNQTSTEIIHNSDSIGLADPVNKVTNGVTDVSVAKTYDIISWFPKPADSQPAVNLTILPILAMLAFLIMLCLKGCTWFRESTKENDRDSEEEDRSFIILHEGDKEYNDIDFRSDLSTPYDTYSSYMSFLRRNNNYDTVTSVRSLQGSKPYDTVTSYRSLMLQRLENHNSDSVTSYRAFLQRVVKEREHLKDVEVQVELIDEKLKNGDRQNGNRNSRRQQRSNSHSNGDTSVKDNLLEVSVSSGGVHNGKHSVGIGNGVVSREDYTNKPVNRRLYDKSPTRQVHSKSPVHTWCERSPSRRGGEVSPGVDVSTGKKNGQASPKMPRFRVSFVTDDDKGIDVIKANNTHLLKPEEGKLSPNYKQTKDFTANTVQLGDETQHSLYQADIPHDVNTGHNTCDNSGDDTGIVDAGDINTGNIHTDVIDTGNNKSTSNMNACNTSDINTGVIDTRDTNTDDKKTGVITVGDNCTSGIYTGGNNTSVNTGDVDTSDINTTDNKAT